MLNVGENKKQLESKNHTELHSPEEEVKRPSVPKLRLNFLSKNDDLRRPLSSRYKYPSPFKQTLDQDVIQR